jgi:hypothetical protein
MIRIISNLILFLSAIIMPWWVTLPMAIFFALRFKSYYELIALGLILDALYGAPMPVFYGHILVFSLTCALIFVLLEFLKPQLRFI